mmetsp:Transcript_18631/g.46511  ORF Transcript_18631/g.46511 Transcript_18631/m.46511 type:complete len:527 (-) Transcript_18631:371-1951(-)|eukprot:CAMPEP_0178996316 /NCGR_PEP_ID=MMETSP0795-20121207/8306_1 /TAXON_ID=88552 /ORGANISM="Amoebophrya sp., Strain Ameob2" /LENGTH=526 /DNA_ID=CAMNT_0020688703 /DNA_START=131 /DNA_END=1711 /DNA_ORIENTATION=-
MDIDGAASNPPAGGGAAPAADVKPSDSDVNPMIETYGSVRVDRSGLYPDAATGARPTIQMGGLTQRGGENDDQMEVCDEIVPDCEEILPDCEPVMSFTSGGSININGTKMNGRSGLGITINGQAAIDGTTGSGADCAFTVLGKDIPLDPTQPEIVLSTARIQKMCNLDIVGENLQVLKLIANNIERIEGLETCVNLVHLELYQNAIKKIENLEFCGKLEHLDLSFNRIRVLGDLEDHHKPPFAKSLKRLYLPSNKLEDVPDGGLSCFTELEVLELGANRLRKIPADVQHMPKLRELWLGKNKITSMKVDFGVDGAGNGAEVEMEEAGGAAGDAASARPGTPPDGPLLPNLEICSLQCNRLENFDASFFANCGGRLKQLYLSENNLPDFDFASTFKHCPNLETLDVSQNKNLKTLPADFRLAKLEELWCSSCGIDFDDATAPENSKGIAGLWNLKLKCLYLEHCPCYDGNYPDGGEKYKQVLRKVCGPSLTQLDALDLEFEDQVKEHKYETIYAARDDTVPGIRRVP